MKPFAILAFLLCYNSIVFPQQNSCENQIVLVNARDKQGLFIHGLQAENFRASIRGKDAAVLSVTPGTGPIRVVIVLDVSGSMDVGKKRQIARFTTGELVHSLRGYPDFALVIFGSRVLGTVPFGRTRKEVMDAIDAGAYTSPVPRERQTALRDALLYASDLLTPSKIGDSVVLATDGNDTHSKTGADTIKHAYISKGIRLFVFLPPITSYFQTEEERSGPSDMRDMAEATGGFVAQLDDVNGPRMFTVSHTVEDLIANYYQLRLASAGMLEKPEPLKLGLIDSTGKKGKDADLMFPRKLYPCTQPLAQR